MTLSPEVWLGPAAWAAVYASDYAFTIACARLYRAQGTIVFEGSYEITPAFQADVNALRRLSPRFLGILAGTTAYLLWLSDVSLRWGTRGAYSLALGALLLVEGAVHVRHVRNWYTFRRLVGSGGVRGHIEYPRAGMLRASAVELLSFAVLFGVVAGVTGSLFVSGGALGCAALSLNHHRLARRHEAMVARAA